MKLILKKKKSLDSDSSNFSMTNFVNMLFKTIDPSRILNQTSKAKYLNIFKK